MQIDPFYIFGFVMVWVAIPVFAGYMLWQILKYRKEKKKALGAKGIKSWVNCVNDPDGPERPTEEDVRRY